MSSGCPLDFLWISSGISPVFLWISSGFHLDLLWISSVFNKATNSTVYIKHLQNSTKYNI
jgi:hypothetical protein